jgi:hypothetical protein
MEEASCAAANECLRLRSGADTTTDTSQSINLLQGNQSENECQSQSWCSRAAVDTGNDDGSVASAPAVARYRSSFSRPSSLCLTPTCFGWSVRSSPRLSVASSRPSTGSSIAFRLANEHTAESVQASQYRSRHANSKSILVFYDYAKPSRSSPRHTPTPDIICH